MQVNLTYLEVGSNNILLLFKMNKCKFYNAAVLSKETSEGEVEILNINPNIEALLGILYKGRTKETFFKFKEIQAEVKCQERNSLVLSLVLHLVH